MPLATISGIEVSCHLGSTLAECLGARPRPFTSLSQHPSWKLIPYDKIPGGWLKNRQPLLGRRYGIATNAALLATGNLLKKLRWTTAELQEAWIFAATSRGNIAEYQGSERRSFAKLAASNTLHSEIAAAVSIAHGIRGPWQLISNGCAASLDALGLAGMAVASGLAPRALVVAAEMPLCSSVLRAFESSGVLSHSSVVHHPYSPNADGFILAEGAAAAALEPATTPGAKLLAYQAGSDAWDALALAPFSHSVLPSLLEKLRQQTGPPTTICPHGAGTQECRDLELATLAALGISHLPPSLWKHTVGHTLGTSGLLELALATQGLTSSGICWKWASSMGGHHAAVAVSL